MTEEEIRLLVEETVRRVIEEYLRGNLGELAAEAINERRRAQGKYELDI